MRGKRCVGTHAHAAPTARTGSSSSLPRPPSLSFDSTISRRPSLLCLSHAALCSRGTAYPSNVTDIWLRSRYSQGMATSLNHIRHC